MNWVKLTSVHAPHHEVIVNLDHVVAITTYKEHTVLDMGYPDGVWEVQEAPKQIFAALSIKPIVVAGVDPKRP